MVGEKAIGALTESSNIILIAKSTVFALVVLVLFKLFLRWYKEKQKEMRYAKEDD